MLEFDFDLESPSKESSEAVRARSMREGCPSCESRIFTDISLPVLVFLVKTVISPSEIVAEVEEEADLSTLGAEEARDGEIQEDWPSFSVSLVLRGDAASVEGFVEVGEVEFTWVGFELSLEWARGGSARGTVLEPSGCAAGGTGCGATG